jgi:hypothetical protein
MAALNTRERGWVPFLAGLLAGAAGAVLMQGIGARRRLDPRLIEGSREDPDLPPTVVVPGILGSELVRPDGTQVWLNLGNAFGYHDLSLPLTVPLSQSRDELRPAGLLGVDAVLPRLFGFTEYADLLGLLEGAGFRRAHDPAARARATCSRRLAARAWSMARFPETLETMAGRAETRGRRRRGCGGPSRRRRPAAPEPAPIRPDLRRAAHP